MLDLQGGDAGLSSVAGLIARYYAATLIPQGPRLIKIRVIARRNKPAIPRQKRRLSNQRGLKKLRKRRKSNQRVSQIGD